MEAEEIISMENRLFAINGIANESRFSVHIGGEAGEKVGVKWGIDTDIAISSGAKVLQLLLDDKAGMFVDSSDELVSILLRMLDNDAFQWRQMRSAMQRASRSGGAVHVANEVERRFFL